MSGSTLSSPVAYIDANGIHVPSFEDVLNFFVAAYQAIYGSDVYLGNDSQDGQLLGIFASAVNDSNALAFSLYNAYSPQTAQGVGLSTVVKINGLARLPASNSQVGLVVSGAAGTTILNGVARDAQNNLWNLPASVVIPATGFITVTAIAAAPGAINAAPNTITQIQTPTYGWQGVSNPVAAIAGVNLESDAALRIRQAKSTAAPAQTPLQALTGAIANLPGVGRISPYENDTGSSDINGVPGHTIAYVVEGGDVQTIVNTIGARKTPGTGTYGTISGTYIDAYGIPHIIRYSQPTEVTITVQIILHPLTGYTSAIGLEVAAAVANYISNLPIGQNVMVGRLFVPANLAGPYANPNSPTDLSTYELLSIQLARGAAPPVAQDVGIGYNEAANCTTANVTIVLA